MLECRYYGNWHGHEIKTVCQFYRSMADVESLLALADEMDSASEDGLLVRDSDLMAWTRRIREALGVEQ